VQVEQPSHCVLKSEERWAAENRGREAGCCAGIFEGQAGEMLVQQKMRKKHSAARNFWRYIELPWCWQAGARMPKSSSRKSFIVGMDSKNAE
jgi:hypothetical protein